MENKLNELEQVKDNIRIDKWLWAVRIFKTRVLSGEMCKRGKVKIQGQRIKSSRLVKIGDKITVTKDNINWEYEVLKCIEKRVGAKIAEECKKDCTPEEEKIKLQKIKSVYLPRRERGAGRPTKKERRQLDNIK
jgi:ribosome-associated heat shock protein Hsp15